MAGARWTEDELRLLADTSLSLAEVAQQTGRSYESVKSRVRMRRPGGVRRQELAESWSEAELGVLLDSSLTYGQIAEVTGRSLSAVEHMSLRCGVDRSARTGVGLKKGDDNPWRPWELDLARNTDLTLIEVAERTGRPYDSAKQVAFRLGVRRHDGSWTEQYRGADWPATRRSILERDGYVCQDCGLFQPSGRDLHVHHIIPYRLLPDNLPRWLVTLCNSCHPKRPEHRWRTIPPHVLEVLALPA